VVFCWKGSHDLVWSREFFIWMVVGLYIVYLGVGVDGLDRWVLMWGIYFCGGRGSILCCAWWELILSIVGGGFDAYLCVGLELRACGSGWDLVFIVMCGI
jgi:hypothetical protein